MYVCKFFFFFFTLRSHNVQVRNVYTSCQTFQQRMNYVCCLVTSPSPGLLVHRIQDSRAQVYLAFLVVYHLVLKKKAEGHHYTVQDLAA